MNHPDDLDARGSDPVWRLHRHLRPAGIGKEDNYSYDIYEVEFIPEALLGVSYRKSLTTLFPCFLNAMADAHGADIRCYLENAFGYTWNLATSTDRLIDLFRELGADMYFDGEVKEEQIRALPVESQMSMDQRIRMIRARMRDQGGEDALRSWSKAKQMYSVGGIHISKNGHADHGRQCHPCDHFVSAGGILRRFVQ